MSKFENSTAFPGCLAYIILDPFLRKLLTEKGRPFTMSKPKGNLYTRYIDCVNGDTLEYARLIAPVLCTNPLHQFLEFVQTHSSVAVTSLKSSLENKQQKEMATT